MAGFTIGGGIGVAARGKGGTIGIAAVMTLDTAPHNQIVIHALAQRKSKSGMATATIIACRDMVGWLEWGTIGIAGKMTAAAITRHQIMIQIRIGKVLPEERSVAVATGLGRGQMIDGLANGAHAIMAAGTGSIDQIVIQNGASKLKG